MICCDNQKIAHVGAKCNDMFSLTYENIEIDGYVPSGLNIGGGYYVEFNFCLNCGQIQNFKPVDIQNVKNEE